MDGPGPLPDSKWELGVLVLAVVAVFAGAFVYVQHHPGAPWQLAAAYSTVVHTAFSAAAPGGGTADVDATTTLQLPDRDAQYLNRQYRELNTRADDEVGEAAFCLFRIQDTLRVHKAGTLEASESSVRFTTANCRSEVFGVDVTPAVYGALHFHPSGDPVLSGPATAAHPEMNDKRSLLDAPFTLSCVQAGLIPEEPGTKPAALKCYTAPESGDIADPFPEVPVVIAG